MCSSGLVSLQQLLGLVSVHAVYKKKLRYNLVSEREQYHAVDKELEFDLFLLVVKETTVAKKAHPLLITPCMPTLILLSNQWVHICTQAK